MNYIRRPVWFPALIVAVLLHAAIAVAMLLQAPTGGTALTGVSGMQVGLAASGRAAGEVAEVEGAPAEVGAHAPETAETVTTEAVAEAVPAPAPLPEAKDPPAASVPVETSAVAEVRPPPPQPSAPSDPQPAAPVHETLEMVSPTATRSAIEAVELSDPAPSPPPEPATEALATVSPPPLPAPRPRRPVRQTVEAAQPQPAVAPETVAAVNMTTPAPEAEPATDAARTTGPGDAVQQAALVTGGGGSSGDRSGEGVSSQDGTRSGGGSPGEREDYLTRLLNWLERHKEYPRRAQRRRQEGTTLLFFRMDRDGRVTDFRIEQGSGHALLDAEVEAMIQRAQPLPAMPDFMRQSQLELVVPVNFALR